MWKYVLIVLFVLLAIRELNLMNQSLYITPDNKIVVKDKTTATELKKFINKIKHNEFLINEPETIQEINISTPKKPVKQEQNTTAQSPLLHNEPEKINKITANPFSKTTTFANKFQETTNKHNKEQSEPLTATPSDYPEDFENAEEKVRRILKQMRAQ